MKINEEILYKESAFIRYESDINLPLMKELLNIRFYKNKRFLFWKYKKYIRCKYSIAELRIIVQQIEETPDFIEIDYLY